MSFELRDLRWAIVASENRSLRRAAEILNVRQSTLSRRLRDLERDLGAVLFERSNGGTRPTTEGQEFLRSARRILEETDEIAVRLKARSRGECGRLIIGIHASLSAGNLRATLIEHQRRFPHVETQLTDGSGDHLISELGSRAVDIAFLVEGNSRWDGRSLPVWSERVVAALPEAHPLSGRDAIQWADLEGTPLLMPQRGPGPEFLKLLVEKIGCAQPCNVRRHDVSLDRLLTLVGAGAGILLALEGATGFTYPGVVFREVRERNRPTRLTFRAFWHPDNANPSLRSFLDILGERYPDLAGEAVSAL